jgi:hypothetical protein
MAKKHSKSRCTTPLDCAVPIFFVSVHDPALRERISKMTREEMIAELQGEPRPAFRTAAPLLPQVCLDVNPNTPDPTKAEATTFIEKWGRKVGVASRRS